MACRLARPYVYPVPPVPEVPSSSAESPMTDTPETAKPALEMLRGVGGDDMVAMLMRTFVQFAEERVGKLAEEAKAGRWSEVGSIAHAIKSSARQLGAIPLADACADAETAARSDDPAGAASGVVRIQREFERARPWMDALANGTP
jgi:two-component system sensor histidine kinase/response regulator